ncbi:unnamed protein product [Alopecurus aequalis]
MACVVASKGPEMDSITEKMLADALEGADAGGRRLPRDLTVPSFFSQDVASKGPEMASLVKKLLTEPAASGAPVAVDADAGDRRLARDLTMPSFFSQGTRPRLASPPSRFILASFVCGEGAYQVFSAVLDFPDVLDRFGAPTSLGGLLAPGRGWSVAKEDDEAVYLKVPMPGLGKEHVKVSAEQNSVVIKGEGQKDPWNTAVPRYSRRIDLPAGAFKMDKIKAVMKDGVLRVTVLKLKEEERKDVFHVQVE